MIGSRFGKLLLPLALLASVLVVISVSPQSADASFPGTNDKIVYERSGDIWIMDADGDNEKPLYPGDLSTERSPAWSPDGTKIAFSSTKDTTLGDGPNIWIMDADGENPRQLTTSLLDDFQPTWSPNGEWLVFERNVGFTLGPWTASATTTTTELVDIVNDFGDYGIKEGMIVTVGAVTAVIDSVDDADTLTLKTPIPLLAPGSTYTISGDKYELFIIDPDTVPVVAADGLGTDVSAQMPAGGVTVYSDYAPSWSPMGDKLAFSTGRNWDATDPLASSDDVYTVTISLASGAVTAASLSNLTDTIVPLGPDLWQDLSWEPEWSPDASKIAFQSQKGSGTSQGEENIWVMSSAGAAKTQLTATTMFDRSPAWSPDGTMIAFTRDMGALFVDDNEDLWVVPATGGTASRLTNTTTTAHEGQPSWGRMFKAVNDTYGVVTGGSLTEAAPGVLGNDPGLGGNPLVTATLKTAPAHAVGGSFTFNADGSFTYTHDGSDFDDEFTYEVADAGGNKSNVATVTIDTPANAAPVAKNDTYEVAKGATLNVVAPGVLTNDTDVEDGRPGTAVKKTDPTHGTLTLSANGSFTYVHDGSSATSDSFTYQAQDSGGKLSNVATVTIKLSGDIHTVGLVDPATGKWYLYDENGVQQKTFFYGNPGDFPIYGDWNCNGEETPGMYRQSDGFVYLRDSNTQGIGDTRFFFGNPGDIPLAGDFNGDGCDTVSIYRAPEQRFYIINELGKNEGGLGEAEFSYVFGNPGDKPFVGDFDGDGIETVGLHRESTGLVYFRNTHTQGNADAQFIFGDPDDRLVAGDWTGDGIFTPALFRPSDTTMYFRYTNTQGNADAQWTNGQSSWLPISGDNGLG